MATNLTHLDLEALRRFGIDEELLADAGVERVTDAEARELLGGRHHGDLSGVLFPRRDPRSGRTVGYRVRRDHPDVEDGRPTRKYLASLDRAGLYFCPSAGPLLHAIHVTVVLVEAEKSVLALTAAATHERKTILAVGLGGCWGWRGRIGKTTDANGARVDERGPLPDLALIEWRDRDVVLLLDANAAVNPAVQSAQRALATELTNRGARVRIGQLPLDAGINGPDDYIAVRGQSAIWSVIDAAGGATESTTRTDRQVSMATQLVDLVHRQDVELWHTPAGDETFVTVTVDGRREHHALGSSRFSEWLARLHYGLTKTIPSNRAITDAITTLIGKARYEGRAYNAFSRIADVDGRLYIDLGSVDWSVVEITRDGWRVVCDAPVRFRRASGMGALPMPERGGNVDEIGAVLGITGDASILVVAWLIGALYAKGPYPLLSLCGEQGSGKSTRARMIRTLIDPVDADLRAEPRDVRDLMVAASNNHVLTFDNLSKLPTWLSDALCRLSTGGSFGTRKLYSDCDEVVMTAVRPIIMTGINEVAVRGDLLDRCISLNLPALADKDRRTEEAVWAEFERQHPKMLGALLDAVSGALRRQHEVSLPYLPRMADWAMRTAAAELAMGWSSGTVLGAYTRNRQGAVHEALEGDSLAEAIRLLSLPWIGTVGDLLGTFDSTTGKAPKGLPTSPRALGGALRRLAPDLRRIGIAVRMGELREGGTGRRLVRIINVDSHDCHIDPVTSVESAGCRDDGTRDSDRHVSSSRRDDPETAADDACDGCDGLNSASPDCLRERGTV